MPGLRVHHLMLASQSGSYLTSIEIKIKQFQCVCAHGRKHEQLSLVSDLCHTSRETCISFQDLLYSMPS